MSNFAAKFKSRSRFVIDVGIIFFCSILITFPLYWMGIPGGADMPQHFQFAQVFYDSIINGVIYPSWSDQINLGYGDVGIRFYPPLTYYVLSVFRIFAGNWYDAACLGIVFFFFFSGVGTYLWAREWFSENSSLAGALFYLIIPYHLNQIYQATMIAEFAAAAILPFCFLYVTRVCQKGKQIDLCGLALSFGLLILTHIPTTVMASVALSIYVLFSLRKTDFIQTIAKLALAVLFAVLLSSFYWIRMVTELNWVKHNLEIYTSGVYSYRTNFAFPFLAQLFGVELSSTSNFLSYLVLVTIGVLIPVVVFHFADAKAKKIQPLTNVLAMTAFTLFMVLPFSLFIWQNVSILQKIQFPWRWMIFVSLGASIFVAASFNIIIDYFKTPKRYLSLIAIGCLFICLPYNGFRILNHIFYTPKDFFNGMTERLKTSYSNDCWWTTWIPSEYSAEKNQTVSLLHLIADKVVIEGRSFELQKWQSVERNFVINAGNADTATVATMYYPHWKAIINGKPTEVTPNKSGFISLQIPPENAEVKLFFQEPSHIIAAYYLSSFGWILLLGLLFFHSFKNFRLMNAEARTQ